MGTPAGGTGVQRFTTPADHHITKTTTCASPASPHQPGRPPEPASPAGTSPAGQGQSPCPPCGGSGEVVVVGRAADARCIRPVCLTPLWQVVPQARGPRGTGAPGAGTVVSPGGTGAPGAGGGQDSGTGAPGAGGGQDSGTGAPGAGGCQDSGTGQPVTWRGARVETLDEGDFLGRPGAWRGSPAAPPSPSPRAEDPLVLVLRRGEGHLLKDATRRDRHAIHLTDEEIPFIDDDADSSSSSRRGEAEPVQLRTTRRGTADPASRLKRHGGHGPAADPTAAAAAAVPLHHHHHSPTPPSTTHPRPAAVAKELVIYRRKKRETPSKARREAWVVGATLAAAPEGEGTGAAARGEAGTATAATGGEAGTAAAAAGGEAAAAAAAGGEAAAAAAGGEAGTAAAAAGGRPASLDTEALQALLQRLMTTNTAAEAAGLMSVERRGTKALELWARRVTDGYQGVSISNMTTDWRNGLAFCALIHRFRPDLIEYSSLKPENIFENNALAFRVAEQQLGIPALLDAEDMVENDVPDRLSVLTYVSQYYQAFAALGFTLPKQVVNKSSPQSTPTENIKTKLTPPSQPKNKTERKSDKVLVGGRVRREVCAGCSNPVFLAERLLVGSPGQLMHRTCFRCARCNTQLTLASYYETEKGQFCCETCPDEERNDSPEVVDTISISSNTSSKHKRRSSASDTESDYDSDTENSGEENDSYSQDAETLLEDKTHQTDTRSDTLSHSPKVIPKPPKPRTIFLSQTLEGTDVKDDVSKHTENSDTSDRFSNFSQVSPALFGSRDNDVRAKAVGKSGQDDDAKGLKTDPPVTLTLDTGQDHRTTNISNSAIKTSSSIVAERLKMFREISDKSFKTDIKKTNTVFGKRKIEQNYVHVDKTEKEVSDITKRDTENIVEDSDKNKNIEDVSSNADVHVDEVESDSYVNEKEKVVDTVETAENVDESVLPLPAVPSITVTLEKIEVNEKVDKEDSYSHDQPDTKIESHEEPPSEKALPQEVNPFDTDESQEKENGVVVSQSEDISEADNNSATCTPVVDSGADFSSTSIQSVQYPNDLNPFGSEGESETEDVMTGTTVKAEKSDIQVQDAQNTGKKLIKVNLNPFESDDDDDGDDNDFEFKETEKEKEKKEEFKNLNPFWSDNDESPGDSAESTPSKKVKPPRPPPPTLARNSTPSQMYPRSPENKQHSPNSQGDSITRKKIIAPSPSLSVRELFPQTTSPSTSPAQTYPSPSLSTAKSHPSPSPSSPCGSLALKRKARRAPAPPQAVTPKSGRTSPFDSSADTLSVDTVSLCSVGTQNQMTHGQEEDQDEVLSWKMQKDMKNHSNKMNGITEQHAPPPKPSRTFQASKNVTCVPGLPRRPSMSKSEAGEWQRKKGPAPPRPVPQKRAIKKLPMRIVQQELQDIEIKQTELERQGVLLETSIRNRTESTSNNSEEDGNTSGSGPNSIEVEDMILQLFELVNEKNELFRRQTELMYLKREKRLEEEYVELEYQIRCLMLKPPAEKTEVDTAQEEELIARLVKAVEQRDEIINCLELDRLREAQEDESIATHMMKYQEKHIDGVENGSSIQDSPKRKKALRLPKKKKKKEKKDKKGAKADADKDIDETETAEIKKKKKKKKKWLF